MTALHDLSATELVARYRERSLSPVEVTRSVLDRIAAWEPHLHATYALDPDAALAAARVSEARWLRHVSAGDNVGALEGVPAMIKENIATAGTPVPLGSAATELAPAPRDAPPAARLREAGAVILGKTTMPDYGMLSSGLSSFHGLTRNPWDLSKNPGGSSSGAGAGVAAGYGPLHVGTDIGGSVRLPAAWCGVFTLKPSLGRIPIDPPYAGRVAGPMTRTVADAALLMGALAQPDDRDTMSLPAQTIEWQRLERDVAGLRIGVLTDAGVGMSVDPEVGDAVDAAVKRFEAAGARIERVAPFMTRAMLDGMDDFWRMRAWLDLSTLREERRARVLPYIVQWARRGATLSGERVFRGYGQMGAMRDAAVAACRPYDVVLSPTAPIASYAAELAGPSDDPERPFEHIALTLPFNMSEQPAASIDCGRTHAGLPIGLQIVGHRHDDLTVLQVARAWEQMRPAPPPWPEPPAR
jgi:Asp-tRNA(Asn)/Glu-tRNA(Gln) amidotransferase A subunit family amidase